MPFSKGTELIIVYANREIVYLSEAYEELLGFDIATIKKLLLVGDPRICDHDQFTATTEKIKSALLSKKEKVKIDILLYSSVGSKIYSNGAVEIDYNSDNTVKSVVYKGTYTFENFRVYNTRSVLEERLESRNKIVETLSHVTYEIMVNDNTTEVLSEAMRVVGKYLNVDRIYYFSWDEVSKTVSQEIEWTYEGSSAQIKNPDLQNFPFEKMADMKASIENHEIFNAQVKDIKDEGLKEILEAQDIRSLVTVPIVHDNLLSGFLGVDDCNNEREWDNFEIQSLVSLANVFGSSLQIKKIQKEFFIKKTELDTILDGLDDIVFTADWSTLEFKFRNKAFRKHASGILDKNDNNIISFTELLDSSEKTKLKRFTRKIFTEGFARTQFRSVLDNKDFKWVDYSMKVIKHKSFENPFLLGVIRDITKEFEAEQKARKAVQRKQLAEKKNAELEVRTLQMQMNPHFIFNSLNSIQSYIINNEPLAANDFLSKFSNLMRLFLDSSRDKNVSLQNELKLIELYIEIEKIRFPENFDYLIDIEKGIDLSIEIPSMILQPFVENAINHGLRYKKEKGKLEVRIKKDHNNLIAQILDDGIGMEKSIEVQDKIKYGYKSQALNITQERIQIYNMINKAQMSYTIEPLQPEGHEPGVLVTVKFPTTSIENKMN